MYSCRPVPRYRPIVALALVPLLAILLLVPALTMAGQLNRTFDAGPVYSVAALRADLRQHPAAWLRRTVRVRATYIPCVTWIDSLPPQQCADTRPALADATGAILPVASWPTPPLLALARRLPLAGRFLPRPQAPVVGRSAIYRVQIHAAPCVVPGTPPCYAALVDATPGVVVEPGPRAVTGRRLLLYIYPHDGACPMHPYEHWRERPWRG